MLLFYACLPGGKTIVGSIKGFEDGLDNTIRFSNALIDSTFYEANVLDGKIINNNFEIKADDLLYPHLYYIGFTNEMDSIPFRFGEYFIDPSTKSVELHLNSYCSEIDGKTHNEFNSKFKPFIFGSEYDCMSNSFSYYRILHEKEFEEKLLDYVLLYPDSYVALWFLIERYEFKGHNDMLDKVLVSFSDQIKKERLWKKLNKRESTIFKSSTFRY